MPALNIAADQDFAAPDGARRINPGACDQPHPVPGNLNVAAGLTGLPAADVERSRCHHGPVLATRQNDAPAFANPDRLGLNHTTGVDDLIDHIGHRAGRHDNSAAGRPDRTGVGYQGACPGRRFIHGSGNIKVDKPVPLEIHGESWSAGQHHLRQIPLDQPRITHPGRHKGRETCFADRYCALVDHHGVGIGAVCRSREAVAPRHEVFIANARGGGDQTLDIDLPT